MMPRPSPKPLPESFTPEEIARFWSHVEKRGPDECWPWKGARWKNGYAMCWFRGVFYRASRIAIKITTGVDPDKLEAMHTCENNPDFIGNHCTNPGHLKPGTPAENGEYKRGRSHETTCIGSKHPRAKMNEQQAEELLRLRSEHGIGFRELGLMFGISTDAAKQTVYGDIWKHVEGRRETPKKRLTAEQRAEIHRLDALGLTQVEIGQKIGRTQSMVSKILRGDSWAE